MTQIPTGGKAADRPAEIDSAWQQLEGGLTAYLEALRERIPSGVELDNELRLDVPTLVAGGPAPFARLWFDGTRHHVDVRGLRDPGHWPVECDPVDAAHLVTHLVATLRDEVELPHPGLLTYSCSGPAEAQAAALGLVPTSEVTLEPAAPDTVVVPVPADRDQLHALVADALTQARGEAPTVDDDGDFVLECMGQPLYVRVEQDKPVVSIFAVVVGGVRSQRQTAVELSILNRSTTFEHFHLHGRNIFLQASIPAAPFSVDHLSAALESYHATFTRRRDDLALRTGGRTHP